MLIATNLIKNPDPTAIDNVLSELANYNNIDGDYLMTYELSRFYPRVIIYICKHIYVAHKRI